MVAGSGVVPAGPSRPAVDRYLSFDGKPASSRRQDLVDGVGVDTVVPDVRVGQVFVEIAKGGDGSLYGPRSFGGLGVAVPGLAKRLGGDDPIGVAATAGSDHADASVPR
jgi:hypothetical protein